jgi:hypothetical protein
MTPPTPQERWTRGGRSSQSAPPRCDHHLCRRTCALQQNQKASGVVSQGGIESPPVFQAPRRCVSALPANVPHNRHLPGDRSPKRWCPPVSPVAAGEASFGAKIIELLGQLGVCEFLFVGGYLLGVIADVAVLRILERLRGELLFSCHYESSDPNVYRVGFVVNLFFHCITRSTCRRETRCSLAMTREPTVARFP